jgi:hypothetical protein
VTARLCSDVHAHTELTGLQHQVVNETVLKGANAYVLIYSFLSGYSIELKKKDRPSKSDPLHILIADKPTEHLLYPT